MMARLKNRLRILRRNAASFWYTNKNRMLGRSFVRHPRSRLFIEPVSFCNLNCKFCSYPKEVRPRTVMPEALFRKSVAAAAAMGFDTIALTPITGDVFMDKDFVDRLRLVDASRVRNHVFYTNFIGADKDAIEAVLALDKLGYMEISVYGHDLESFRNITGRERVQYERLVKNLQTLIELYPTKPEQLDFVIGIRTYRSFDFETHPRNDLLDAIDRLKLLGVPVGRSSYVDNWGGDVTAEDVADIEMDLTDGRALYKNGPCSLPFDSIQITATGEVNACACRDPRGSLTIGDLNTTPLSEILSPANRRWMNIIESHERGAFNEVCRQCGFYQSIYDERRHDYGEMLTKQDYFSSLE